MAKFYIEQDVWDTDVAHYGIDIWMTTNAITQGFRICQSNLGVKIHDAKDPGQHLGPMFRQVIWTLFSLMERYESYWKKVKGSEPLEMFGFEGAMEPEPVKVDIDGMISTCEQIISSANENSIIIPGHGRISNKHDLINYTDMMKTIRNRISQGINNGNSLEQIIESDPAKEYNSILDKAEFIKLYYDSLLQDK